MYLDYFSLNELPFSITPDTGFYFNNPSHQQAMNVLQVALRSGEGFIKITGEVGTGKTLLCRQLLNQLSNDEQYVTAYLPNPNLGPSALNLALAEEMGLQCSKNSNQHNVLKSINERLIALTAEGKNVVLLIDEAQAMPEKSLEALRLLTNLETEKNKLLQIVLFGQPELNEMLEKPSIRQLKQRIIFSYALEPMNKEGVQAYLSHRLLTAGYAGTTLFSRRVIEQIFKASRGIPRLINILAHKSLMVAYGQGAKRISSKHIRAAIEDTEDANNLDVNRQRWIFALSGLAVSLLIAVGIYVYTGKFL